MRFLSSPLFGLKTAGYTPFWPQNSGIYPLFGLKTAGYTPFWRVPRKGTHQPGRGGRVCVIHCVVIPFILDVGLVDAPAGVTQDFSSTFLLRCVPSFLSREGFRRPFPSSTVKSNFGYPRINRPPLVRHFFFVKKYPSSCECTEIRTHVLTSEGFEVTN